MIKSTQKMAQINNQYSLSFLQSREADANKMAWQDEVLWYLGMRGGDNGGQPLQRQDAAQSLAYPPAEAPYSGSSNSGRSPQYGRWHIVPVR